MLRKVNLRVEKSLYPEGENTHILVLESSTEHGWNFEGIFKGTKKECIEKKKELEGLENDTKGNMERHS